jgi:flagellar hook-basal body complex protein FliE
MIPIGSINPATTILHPGQVTGPFGSPLVSSPNELRSAQPSADGFAHMLDGLIASVDAKQTQADAVAKQVLLGGTDQLHQSVIAMQEATTALSLMVQVRNKLVESYQELMRMQV